MLKCKKGYEVKPCRSATGFYMGTHDEEDMPNCRVSTAYAKTREEAEKLRLDRQDATENSFCNGCGNCGIREV